MHHSIFLMCIGVFNYYHDMVNSFQIYLHCLLSSYCFDLNSDPNYYDLERSKMAVFQNKKAPKMLYFKAFLHME